MADYLVTLSNDPRSAGFLKKLGLPTPVSLARVVGGSVAQPLAGQVALVLAAPGSYATAAAAAALQSAGADVCDADALPADEKLPIVLMDATGCSTVQGLRAMFDGLQTVVKRLRKNARILLLATRPTAVTEPVAAGCARAVEGFTRSLAKEVGKLGCTVNLAYLEPHALPYVRGVVAFFCSPRCTYVTGQTVTLRPPLYPATLDRNMRYLSGKTAVVTGCARGIGRAIAHRLAEEGAHVIGVDVPSARDALYELALQIGGTPMVLDIAEAGAADELATLIDDKCDAVDIVVHNAGITRDKTLANMTSVQWDTVLDINFAAIARIDQTLLNRALVRDAGRIVCLSLLATMAKATMRPVKPP
jgi:3-oxoacyl-[acyl-carrier protein] reductase